jgi:hypothetical protein
MITINQGSQLPWTFRLFGLILIIGGISAIPFSIVLFILMDILGLILITAKSGIIFNRELKTYKEYQSFLNLKFGQFNDLKPIEKIFINQNIKKSTMYTPHTANSRSTKNTFFNGYLKFEDGEKIYLKSSRKKGLLENELNKLSEYLKVNLVDNTG